MELKKITFKVAYLHSGTTARALDLLKVDKIGNTTFIDTSGSMFQRPLGERETPAKIILSAIESYKDAQGEIRKKVYKELSYYTEECSGEAFKTISELEQAEHLINKQAHELLKSHQNVIWRDASGNDQNPNRYGAITNYELIEETQNIINKMQENFSKQKAETIATELFLEDKAGFIDICYAYGVRPVEGVEIEKLYNEVMLKISINPQHFLDVHADKHKEMKIIIAKALQLEDETNNPLITINNDLYYMTGDILGSNVDEVIHYFETHPKAKEYLFTKLGVKKEIEVAVKNLSPVQEKVDLTPQAKIYKTRVDAARVEEMERSVKVEIRKFKEAIKKGNKKEDAMYALSGSLDIKRGNFADVAEVFDEFVAKEKSFL
jgi:GTPase SAR1 family protein